MKRTKKKTKRLKVSLKTVTPQEAHELVLETAKSVDAFIEKRLKSRAHELQQWLLRGRILNLLSQQHYGLLLADSQRALESIVIDLSGAEKK